MSLLAAVALACGDTAGVGSGRLLDAYVLVGDEGASAAGFAGVGEDLVILPGSDPGGSPLVVVLGPGDTAHAAGPGYSLWIAELRSPPGAVGFLRQLPAVGGVTDRGALGSHALAVVESEARGGGNRRVYVGSPLGIDRYELNDAGELGGWCRFALHEDSGTRELGSPGPSVLLSLDGLHEGAWQEPSDWLFIGQRVSPISAPAAGFEVAQSALQVRRVALPCGTDPASAHAEAGGLQVTDDDRWPEQPGGIGEVAVASVSSATGARVLVTNHVYDGSVEFQLDYIDSDMRVTRSLRVAVPSAISVPRGAHVDGMGRTFAVRALEGGEVALVALGHPDRLDSFEDAPYVLPDLWVAIVGSEADVSYVRVPLHEQLDWSRFTGKLRPAFYWRSARLDVEVIRSEETRLSLVVVLGDSGIRYLRGGGLSGGVWVFAIEVPR